jgi:hypothetical protein
MSAPRRRALQLAQRDLACKARCSVRAFHSIEAGISYREPSKRQIASALELEDVEACPPAPSTRNPHP